jgi:hypothetical protein
MTDDIPAFIFTKYCGIANIIYLYTVNFIAYCSFTAKPLPCQKRTLLRSLNFAREKSAYNEA